MTLSFTNNDYLLPSTSYVGEASRVLVDGKSIEEIRADERTKTIDEFLHRIIDFFDEPFAFEYVNVEVFERMAEEMKGETE